MCKVCILNKIKIDNKLRSATKKRIYALANRKNLHLDFYFIPIRFLHTEQSH